MVCLYHGILNISLDRHFLAFIVPLLFYVHCIFNSCDFDLVSRYIIDNKIYSVGIRNVVLVLDVGKTNLKLPQVEAIYYFY